MLKTVLRPAILCIACGCPLSAPSAVIIDPSVTLTRESIRIAAGDHARYAYRLTAEAELVFSVRTSRWRRDALRLWLLDEANYRNWRLSRPFEAYGPSPFVTKRGGRLVFAVPRGGLYHVVLDNAEARSPKDVSVYAYANMTMPSEEDGRIRRAYEGYYEELSALLEFEAFDIHIRRCGYANAFATPDIIICKEFDELLAASPTEGLRLFVLMHEVAHNLLYTWGYRSIFSDQYMTDRLAATLIEMMDRKEIAMDAAEWFESNAAFSASSGDAPSPPAPLVMRKGRARKIADWLKDDEQLELLWTRRIVFPRMRTPALESLLEAGELGVRTLRRIERELEGRR